MKKILNSNYKKYCFFDFMSCMFAFDSIFNFAFFVATKDISSFYSIFISLLLGVIFDIYRSKYFKLTYQFKKNAKKFRG